MTRFRWLAFMVRCIYRALDELAFQYRAKQVLRQLVSELSRAWHLEVHQSLLAIARDFPPVAFFTVSYHDASPGCFDTSRVVASEDGHFLERWNLADDVRSLPASGCHAACLHCLLDSSRRKVCLICEAKRKPPVIPGAEEED